MRTQFLFFILVMILISSTGCSGGDAITLTASDSGSAITLKPGDTLVVRLEGNPSTGYTWDVLDVNTQVLEQVGETEFESSLPPAEIAPGTGGTLVLTFTARDPGSTTLTLGYHRPWETTEMPLETFTLNVTVE